MTITATGADAAAVAEAAAGLQPFPQRGYRWTHLSLCVLDAVFSIGARYSTTCRTVHSYAQYADIAQPLAPAADVASGRLTDRKEPVSSLRDRIAEHGPAAFAREVVRNRQRTSPRGGVLKAEAVLSYATILERHGVPRLAEVPELLANDGRLRAIEAELAEVPGHGAFGIRTGYLWMLAGSDDVIKPDRMVLGWLSKVLDRGVAAPEARELVTAASEGLGVTPWQLDHAIWNEWRSAGRRRPRDGRGPEPGSPA